MKTLRADQRRPDCRWAVIDQTAVVSFSEVLNPPRIKKDSH